MSKEDIIKYALNFLLSNIDEITEEDFHLTAEEIEKKVTEVIEETFPEKEDEIKLEPIPKPIGQFIIDQGVEGWKGNDGMYYHYTDVCSLLKKFKTNNEGYG